MLRHPGPSACSPRRTRLRRPPSPSPLHTPPRPPVRDETPSYGRPQLGVSVATRGLGGSGAGAGQWGGEAGQPPPHTTPPRTPPRPPVRDETPSYGRPQLGVSAATRGLGGSEAGAGPGSGPAGVGASRGRGQPGPASRGPGPGGVRRRLLGRAYRGTGRSPSGLQATRDRCPRRHPDPDRAHSHGRRSAGSDVRSARP